MRGEEGPPDKVKERSDQFGTCLVMASSETKAVHVVPVPTKGTASLKTVTEEVIRFSLENSSMDPVVFQGDPERAIRQILRSVQQVRAVMGLSSEVRMTGTNQHSSNGQAERAVQNVRRLANCLRSFVETRARVNILGTCMCTLGPSGTRHSCSTASASWRSLGRQAMSWQQDMHTEENWHSSGNP